jgi:hypothetical protein
MSGKKEEVLATFKAAQEEFGESKAGKVVIKKVIDDNYGGGKEHFTSTDVYESSDDHKAIQNNYIKR